MEESIFFTSSLEVAIEAEDGALIVRKAGLIVLSTFVLVLVFVFLLVLFSCVRWFFRAPRSAAAVSAAHR